MSTFPDELPEDQVEPMPPWPDDDSLDDDYEADLDHRRRVSDELDRLRVREDARRIFDLERHPPTDYAGLYLDADQLDTLPTADPLIDKVLNRHSYAILNGRDHSFKTFVALDWAFCLATGKPWQGRDVDPVPVLYIAGEGAYGLDQRKQAWEAAWKHKIPPQMFVTRSRALDLHAGGPALDELLQRITDGHYGLVVVDTLRRVSGRADGNGSEMGIVVDNIDRLRRATDQGSILVLAHTAKDDKDSRGFSGIEDDADIVWHARRPTDGPPMGLDLVNRKMKDGPDGESIELTMSPVLDSLVVSRYARTGQTAGLLAVENFESDDQMMTAMRETFAQTGASITQLIEVTDLPRSTAYKSRGRLLASGQLVPRKKGATQYLYLPGTPVESPWNPTPDSTPVHTTSSTPVHADAEHESTAVHTSPRPDSTPVHTPPPVYKTGVAWTETETRCPLHPEKPRPDACSTCEQNHLEAS
ncbi:AAA family ATPase [Phycicoccus duodecadis]|uniref:AAA domain-containing protein n=1 Tax=Phycicoccus duodecadis TaxID=173053 RepID=A0A2N3YF27_9MICO|nr:AAA family ATPase [Phycicoccus duodecadis]PKW25410.1 AAA domain-containing protein [Phycicoccus duodecadis]